jgi:hypothetical protein
MIFYHGQLFMELEIIQKIKLIWEKNKNKKISCPYTGIGDNDRLGYQLLSSRFLHRLLQATPQLLRELVQHLADQPGGVGVIGGRQVLAQQIGRLGR